MNTITAQKPFEEIEALLEDIRRVYIIGCGTCTTICHTGGKSQVISMKTRLEEMGKTVTGWMVIPTACDNMTKEALEQDAVRINDADVILVMVCGFGAQTVAGFASKPVYPALNTLFVGKEETPGHFTRMCAQCGDCILTLTGGICPLTTCTKGLISGPCGGAKDGKCEFESEIRDCGWHLIYERLKELGRLDELLKVGKPRDYSKAQLRSMTVQDLEQAEKEIATR